MKKTLGILLAAGYLLAAVMFFSPLTSAHLEKCTAGVYACTELSSSFVFSQTITPVATAAAIGTTEQTFTVTGLLTTDHLVVTKSLVETSLCPMVRARVTAANTVGLQFSTLTAAACTPSAGTHRIVVFR